jgi:uncharacterized phage protein gp47/JayE
MATTYGVTPTGFVTKPLADCKTELEAAFRAAFGADINLDPREPPGQLVGILAEREAALWDLAQDVYRAMDPDANEGDAQDAIAAITGTLREPARASTVTLVVAGTAGTVLASGRVASSPATAYRFATTVAATIAAATAWAGTTAYTVGQRRANGGEIYEVTIAGTSAGAGGPTGQGSAIVDGGVTWEWVITGTAYADVAAAAEETGPKQALAGSITVIETPVAGWTAVRNPLDAVVGADLETAAALRIRREDELRAVGGAAQDAIRADVLAVDGVTACTVFENTTAVTDADGIPPKAIEVMVSGGADQAIREVLWGSKAAGIETHGGVSGSITDSQGVSHTVEFSRPTAKLVYLDVDIKVGSTFPADGDAQVKAQLVAQTYAAGDDVIAWALKKLVTVAGVLDVPVLRVGLVQWPATEATLTIAARELAKLDSARIRLNHV